MTNLRQLKSNIEYKISEINLNICNLILNKPKADKILHEIELLKLESKLEAYEDTLVMVKAQIEVAERELEELKVFEPNEAATYLS